MTRVAVGDVHGRYDLLGALLSTLADDGRLGRDELVFLGDMVDRGKQSYLVVNEVKNLTEAGHAKAIRGNHEHMMLEDIASGDWCGDRFKASLWRQNGGGKTIESYGGTWPKKNQWLDLFIKEHAEWMRGLPLFYETDHWWFSHAPMANRQAFQLGLHRIDEDGLLWASPYLLGERYPEDEFAVDMAPQRQVVGHLNALYRRQVVPRIYPHIIYADTGCGCADWAPLGAVVLEDDGTCSGYYLVDPNLVTTFVPVVEVKG